MEGDLEARMLAALKLLSRNGEACEDYLIRTFAEDHYDCSAENEREEGRILNQLQIEARNYYKLFIKLGIANKRYQDKPGMGSLKDTLYKLIKSPEEAAQILREYVASQPITNSTINATVNANNNNNT